MKLSFILYLSFAFISLQSVHSLEATSGLWSNPTTTSDTNDLCCVPTSILTETSEAKNTFTATYQYDKTNEKCIKLFGDKEEIASLTFTKNENTETYNAIKTLESDSTKATISFKFNDESKVRIELSTSEEVTGQCKFTMIETKPSNFKRSIISFVVFVLISLILAVYLIFRKPDEYYEDGELSVSKEISLVAPSNPSSSNTAVSGTL